MSTSGVKVYNVTATREVYQLYQQYLDRYPQLSNSYVAHEGYSNAAVRSFRAEDSAFPFREYNHLLYVTLHPRSQTPEQSEINIGA